MPNTLIDRPTFRFLNSYECRFLVCQFSRSFDGDLSFLLPGHLRLPRLEYTGS
jgi:hypothetical protein